MMEMDNGTEQLIIELREGKECAFVKVFRTYYAPLLNYAGRILHDTELANDVVQEAFCGLFERRKELKGNMLLRPYLYKVVYNSCLDAIKHRKVESNYINQELLDFYFSKVVNPRGGIVVSRGGFDRGDSRGSRAIARTLSGNI